MNTATQPAKIRSFDSAKTNSQRNTISFIGFFSKMKEQIGTGCRKPAGYDSMSQRQLEERAAEDMAIAKAMGF